MLIRPIEARQAEPLERFEIFDKAAPEAPCRTCHQRRVKFCCDHAGYDSGAPWGEQEHHTKTQRQNIYRAGENTEGAIAICEGWAVRFAQLPNGKRQVLSLALPGDVVGAVGIFEGAFGFSVQAVTNVHYCYLGANDVRGLFRRNPVAFDVWIRAAAEEQRQSDELLVDLGQRTAQERIARLLLRTMQRMHERKEMRNFQFPFPLRQQQIADLTGLTPVHVSRVLSALRKSGICDVGSRRVSVRNFPELQRIAMVH